MAIEIESIIAQLDLDPKGVGAIQKATKALSELEKQANGAKVGSEEWLDAMKKATVVEKALGKQTDTTRGSIAQLEKEINDLEAAQRRANVTTAKGRKEARAYQKQIERNQKAISDAKGTAQGYGNSLSSIASIAGPALATIFAVDQITAYTRKVIEVTAKFEKFQAVLTNTLGSESQAQAALQQIEKFALGTPFQVDELTDSFVKLANSGFRPTTKELTLLGDLAASKGKSFGQLTEAILDAQTFELERLKEFGIRGIQQGNKIVFTFNGIRTVVDKTSESVKEYILSLGDLEGVQGGTAAVAATLAGKLSNLEDNSTALAKSIGEILSPVFKGFTDNVNDSLKSLRQFFDELKNNTAVQKEISKIPELTVDQIDQKTKDAQARLEALNKFLQDNFSRIKKSGEGFLSDDDKERLNREVGELNLFLDKLEKARAGIAKSEKKEADRQKQLADQVARDRAKSLQPFLELEERLRIALLRARAELEDDELTRLKLMLDVDEQALTASFEEQINAFKEKGLKSGASKQAIEDGVQNLRETLNLELIKLQQEANEKISSILSNELLSDLNGGDGITIDVPIELEFGDDEADNLDKELADRLNLLDKDFSRRRTKIELEGTKTGNRKKEIRDLVALEQEFLAKRLKLLKDGLGASSEIDEFELSQLNLIKGLLDKLGSAEDAALQRREQVYKNFANTVKGVFSDLFSFQAKKIDEEVQLRQDRINQLKGIQSASAEESLREEEQRQDELLRKREQFARAQQIIGAIEAASNVFVGITKVFAESGAASIGTLPAVLGVLTAVLGGVPSIIQPLLGFKDGVIDFQGKGTATSDSNIVAISAGESVITAKGTSNAPKALEAINEGRLTDDMISPSFGLLDGVSFQALSGLDGSKNVQKELKATNKLLEELLAKTSSPTFVENILDENGFSKRIRRREAKKGAIANRR